MPSVPLPADLALLRGRVTELAAENARLRDAAAAGDEPKRTRPQISSTPSHQDRITAERDL